LQIKSIELDKQEVIFKDLGIVDYKSAWDYQELLLQQNLTIKVANRNLVSSESGNKNFDETTTHFFLLCQHTPVYTLGKSGSRENILISEAEMKSRGIEFFNTNRGGDITFHGPQQLVGYPIIDLEKYYTDIGKYLRNIEEVIILTLAEFGIIGERSKGETGVWILPNVKGQERKICAIGVRCSRWVTMHGFALNVNTDLSYFNYIVPCGIQNKQVTSLEKELGKKVDFENVKEIIKQKFEIVFNATFIFQQ
jgi:lipoyl(octanoyl) transferase